MKRTSTVATALAAVIVLAGCGGSASDDDGTIRLVFRQFDPAGEVGGLQDAIDGWNSPKPRRCRSKCRPSARTTSSSSPARPTAATDPTSSSSAPSTSASWPSPRSCCRWTSSWSPHRWTAGTEDLLATDMVHLRRQDLGHAVDRRHHGAGLPARRLGGRRHRRCANDLGGAGRRGRKDRSAPPVAASHGRTAASPVRSSADQLASGYRDQLLDRGPAGPL